VSDTIAVERLGKQFRRYHADRPATLKEVLIRGLRRMGARERFWGLRDVSFRVAPGEMVGVIGRNGSGKSTLLRLIGGVGRPDEGGVKVRGRVGALLDLGAGFHPELTGRENVLVYGVIAGLTRAEVEQRLDAIVRFAELEPYIDGPLRTYSSGMQLRLAFAIGVHTRPAALLIDEVLAVGDLSFQSKCLDRIKQMKAEGCAIVLVSHDMKQIHEHCDRALWLQDGHVAAEGEPAQVVDDYVAAMSAETRRRTPASWPVLHTPGGIALQVHANRFGSLDMEIVGVRLLDQRNREIVELHSGDALRVSIEYRAPQPVAAPIFGVSIYSEEDEVCCDVSTASAGQTLPTLQGAGQISLHFERLDLNGGRYYLDVGVYPRDWGYAYDHHSHAYALEVRPTGSRKGILYSPHHWVLDEA
jgi:lipopolysaccharide transport system ATP-binding protein